MPEAKKVPARFGGPCTECGEKIHKGDMMWYVDNEHMYHSDCFTTSEGRPVAGSFEDAVAQDLDMVLAILQDLSRDSVTMKAKLNTIYERLFPPIPASEAMK